MIQERSKSEIEAKLATMGDYVKIDYLRRALTSGLDFEMRKFVLVKLSEIYEDKGMFVEAAKLMKSAAEINTTFKDKIRDFMKSVELYVKSENYNESDIAFAQALALGNEREKAESKAQLRKYYWTQGKDYIASDKRNKAKKLFEKMLSLDIPAEEKRQVQNELLALYDKLGSVREYFNLKQAMDGTNKY